MRREINKKVDIKRRFGGIIMKNIDLRIKRVSSTCTLPTKAHEDDACFDIYADLNCDEITINPHETVMIGTGFATQIPKGWWAPIFARSGLSWKKGLRPVQGVPVIDAGYRGEWKVALHNDLNFSQTIRNQERIAQFTLLEYPKINLIPVDDFEDETDRGEGGFGSSGER